MVSFQDLPHSARYTLDAVAGVTAVATLTKILPPIAAGLSILWLLIQITEWALKKFRKPDD
jgi:hypothetical protein